MGMDEMEAEATLDALVACALLAWGQVEKSYTLHPLLYQYAQALLSQSGEMAEAGQSHLVYYLRFAQANAGADDPAAHRRIEGEFPNLQLAFRRAQSGQQDDALCRLTLDVQPFFWTHGRLYEWHSWLADALPAAQRLQDFAALGKMQNSLGTLYGRWGEFDKAGDCFEQSRQTYRRLGDRQGEARAMLNLALVAIHGDQFERAEQLLQEALSLVGPEADSAFLRSVHTTLGKFYSDQGKAGEAVVHYRQALVLAQQTANVYDAVFTRSILGHVLAEAGELDEAEREVTQALHEAALHRYSEVEAWAWNYAADVARGRGQRSQAADLNLRSLREALAHDWFELARHNVQALMGMAQQWSNEGHPEATQDLEKQFYALCADLEAKNVEQWLQMWKRTLLANS
jgi:tetratricopeptide (TPR) repeat protein